MFQEDVGIENGMVYDEKKTDFLFGDAVTLIEQIGKVALPNAKNIYSWNQYTYKETRNYCTVVWPMSSIIGYRWDERVNEQRLEAWNYWAENYGYVSDKGHYKTTGETCTLKYWNALNPNKEMLSFGGSRLSKNYWYGLSKWFEACVGYAGNAAWNNDRRDRVLSEVDHWEQTYGHIRRDKAIDINYIMAVDNFIGRKIWGKEVNHYLIPRNNLEKLRRKKHGLTGYFPSATFFVPLKAVSQIPLDWTKYRLSELTKNSKKWNEADNDNRLDQATKLDYQRYLNENNKEIRKKFIIS